MRYPAMGLLVLLLLLPASALAQEGEDAGAAQADSTSTEEAEVGSSQLEEADEEVDEATGLALASAEAFLLGAVFDTSGYGERAALMSDYMADAAGREAKFVSDFVDEWEQRLQVAVLLDKIGGGSGSTSGYGVSSSVERVLSRPKEGYDLRYQTAGDFMRQMKSPPEGYARVHNLLLEMYASYSQLYSLGKDPVRSLDSARQLVSEHKQTISEAASKLSVMY